MPITEEKKQLLKNLQKFGKQEWTAYKDSIFFKNESKKHIYKKSGENDNTKVYFYYMILLFSYK